MNKTNSLFTFCAPYWSLCYITAILATTHINFFGGSLQIQETKDITDCTLYSCQYTYTSCEVQFLDININPIPIPSSILFT